MQLKKGILLLVLAAGTSVFVACKKDKDNENPTCWKCVLTATYTPSMGMGPSTIETEVCEQTESQIRAAEKQASTTTTITMEGISVSQKMEMKCTAK